MKEVFIIFNKDKQRKFVISAIKKAGTEKALSKKVGISQASLYDYKKEIRSIPLKRVKILADFLGLNIKKILIQTKEKYIVKWTKEEENFILKNYKRLTAREISRKLDKTIYSIKHKRKILGLKKGPAYRWGKQQIYDVFNNQLEELNKTPTYNEILKTHPGMICAIERIWGKYSDFLKEQGLKTSIRKWSKKECIYEFEKIRAKINKIPTQNDLKKCRGLPNAIRRRWKNYNFFLKFLGHSPNFELKWDKEKCQNEFKKIMLNRSRLITIHELLKINPALVAAIYKYFHSYPAILKSLEYETNDDWQKWEKLVTKICKKIYPNVVIKPRLKNNKSPDIAVGDEEPFEIIIDAKLNSFANSIPLGIKKYKTSCKELEFWCLLGTKKLNKKTIRIRGFNEIKRLLRDRNEKDLIKELEKII